MCIRDRVVEVPGLPPLQVRAPGALAELLRAEILGRLKEGADLEVPVVDRVAEDVLDVALQPDLEA
eukprot:7966037-Alexandrium_andersonii.AAC.1